MKGGDTRMLEIEFGQFVHVRGEDLLGEIGYGQISAGSSAEFELIVQEKLIERMQTLKGKRVLILELVE